MLIPKQTYIRDRKHREWIASLPCCVTGARGETQCAHIRFQTGAGMGLKPSDSWCIPMHFMAHQSQTDCKDGEDGYWGDRLDKAKQLARDLYAVSGNTSEALRLIAKFRR